MKASGILLKRVFDIFLSFLFILAALPLWIFIASAICAVNGRPVYFVDTRIGRNKIPYRHYKFRTMVKAAEAGTGPVWSKQGDTRVIPFGRLLRMTALDELPQLINILKGDMSFVGPRPERPYFVEQFMGGIPGYEKRFQVRPGLTGMAQVYGRYDTPPQKKLLLDLAYIEKANLMLDIKLIILSFLITLRAGWERFELR